MAKRKETTHPFPFDRGAPEIPSADIAEIRRLIAFWDLAEEGAPGLRRPDGFPLEEGPLPRSVEVFLNHLPVPSGPLRVRNPYFGRPELHFLLEGFPDPKLLSRLHDERDIEFTPSVKALRLWRELNLTGHGIDPKRPLESGRGLSGKTWGDFFLILQFLVSGADYPPPPPAPEEVTESVWNARVCFGYRDFLKAAAEDPPRTKKLLHDPRNEIYAKMKASTETFPAFAWYFLFMARLFILNDERDRAAELLAKINVDGNDELAPGSLRFPELLEAERQKCRGALAEKPRAAITREVRRLEKLLASRGALDFGNELSLFHLKSLLTDP